MGSLSRSDFDLARLRRQFGRMHQVPLVRVQRLEQRRRETARRPQAGARRDVRHRRQFQIMPVHAEQRERLPEDGMLHVRRAWHAFQFRILQDQVRHERVVHRDIDVFVNRRRDQETAEFFVIRRQVRAAAAQRDAKG